MTSRTDEQRARAREYRKNHPELIRAQKKRYREKHNEKIVVYKNKWYQKYRDEILQGYKNHYVENRDKLLLYHKDYYEKNRLMLIAKTRKYWFGVAKMQRKNASNFYARIKFRTKTYKHPELISKDVFKLWFESQPRCCHYCSIPFGDELMGVKKFEDRRFRSSIDRKDNHVGYVEGNLVLCCWTCNLIKNCIFSYDEMIVIGETVRQVWASRGLGLVVVESEVLNSVGALPL